MMNKVFTILSIIALTTLLALQLAFSESSEISGETVVTPRSCLTASVLIP